MRITKLDVLIILVVVVWLYFSFTGSKYFEVKGQDLFGAIMTYDTLAGRGFGIKAEVIGTGFESQKPVRVSGIVLEATGEKMYIWDGETTWVIFQRDRFLELEERPLTPCLYPSSLTLYLSESFSVGEGECGGESFLSENIYLVLDRPANEVLCSYLSRSLWERYRGEIECSYGGNYLELRLTLLKGFDPDFLESLVSEFGYNLENSFSLDRECLVIEYD